MVIIFCIDVSSVSLSNANSSLRFFSWFSCSRRLFSSYSSWYTIWDWSTFDCDLDSN